jgi:organic radical activating enzyme
MYINLPFKLSFQDYPEPDKWAILVYFQGCNRNCIGCQNTDLKDQTGGLYMTPMDLDKHLQQYVNKCHTNCVVLTGGDPLMERQLPTLHEFLTVYGHKYNICVYTGAEQLEIINKMSPITGVKYYKGGAFMEQLKSKTPIGKFSTHFQLATTNQFILDSTYRKLTTNGVLYYG